MIGFEALIRKGVIEDYVDVLMRLWERDHRMVPSTGLVDLKAQCPGIARKIQKYFEGFGLDLGAYCNI